MEFARLTESHKSKTGVCSSDLEASSNLQTSHIQNTKDNSIRYVLSLLLFSLQLLAVLFSVFFICNYFIEGGRQKNDNLVRYKNDMPFNSTFVFSLILHDLTEKKADEVASISQMNYDPDFNSDSASVDFDFSVLSRRLHRRADRYRVEGIVTYQHPNSTKNETVNCFCELSYKVQKLLPKQVNETGESENTEEKHQYSSTTYLRSRLYFQFVFDESIYDFTENPLLQYIYHREPKTKDKTNFDSSSEPRGIYKPRLDCSQFWAVAYDRVNFNDVPEDEEIDIDVNFGLTTIDRYMWGMKLRLAEEYIEKLPNGPRLLDDLKHFFFDNSIQIKYAFLAVLLAQMLFSVITTYRGTSTLSSIFETSLTFKQSVIQTFGRCVIVWYLINQHSSSLAIISASCQAIYAFFIMVSKLTSGSKSSFKNNDEAFPYLLPFLAIVIGLAYGLVSYWTGKSTSLLSCGLAAGATMAYGLILATSLLLSLNCFNTKSVSKISIASILYELFTALTDDVFVLLVEVPMIHKMSAYINDLVLVIFFLQKSIIGKSGSRAADMSESESDWMIDLKKAPKKNGYEKIKQQ